jgi:hypothetical protein
MGGTPDDASDWHAARGLPMGDLGGGGHAARAAHLIARAAALLGRMEGDAAESWLTLGEGLADGTDATGPRIPAQRVRGHAGNG